MPKKMHDKMPRKMMDKPRKMAMDGKDGARKPVRKSKPRAKR